MAGPDGKGGEINAGPVLCSPWHALCSTSVPTAVMGKCFQPHLVVSPGLLLVQAVLTKEAFSSLSCLLPRQVQHQKGEGLC